MLNWRTTIPTVLSLTLMGWAIPAWSAPIHYLRDFRGNVQVKKVEWKNFRQAQRGLTLSGKDQIKLEGNASATISCSNQDEWTLKGPGTYLVSQGCPENDLGPFRLRRGLKTSDPYL